MSVVERILDSFGYARKAAMFEPPAHLRAEADAERWTIPDGSLYRNQAELYQRLSWVSIAVSLSAQAAAGAPLSVKQLTGEDKKDIPNHDFERLLQRPNPLMSRFELLEATYSYRKLTGNAYWFLNRPNENTAPVEIWSLPSHKVQPVPDGNMYLRGYLYYPGGTDGPDKPIPLEPWQVCHFRRFHPLNSYVGLSPIEALATVAIGDMAMQKWNTNFFGKSAAKQPGFLAYADPINPTDWARMKAEMKEQYGSMNRSLMMMQNVGKGGVQWVSTAMSQKDMEFLSARTFNREEIFGIFAPGLSSVLAVNATEANATAGKSTLLEFAIWPEHVSVAEKITNDILPAYGENLVAEFDDVRRTDEALELQKIATYERSHTINEVRKEFYGDDEIDDPRGDTLGGAPAPTTELAGAVAEEAVKTVPILGYHIDSGTVSRNEARAQLGLPAEDESQSQLLRDLQATLSVVKMATDVGIPLDAALSLVGMNVALPEPEPTPPPLMPQDDPRMSPGEAAAAQMPEPPSGKALDLDRWQRKAVKRLKSGKSAACEFESEYIDVDEADTIVDSLKAAATVEQIAAAFKLAPEELTPAERMLADKLTTVFKRSGTEVARRIAAGEAVDLTMLDARLRATLVPTLMEVMLEQATTLAETIGLDFDPAQVATSASEWARQYSFDLVKGLTDTTRGVVQSAVAQYQSTPGMTRDDLVRMLKPAFGEGRAQTIATTEITRSANRATSQYQQELSGAGITMTRVWQTNNDESTCVVCSPLNGKTEDEWSGDFPDGAPAHPRCRCFTTLRMVKK
jgi:HK97 family phage portal protein